MSRLQRLINQVVESLDAGKVSCHTISCPQTKDYSFTVQCEHCVMMPDETFLIQIEEITSVTPTDHAKASY